MSLFNWRGERSVQPPARTEPSTILPDLQRDFRPTEAAAPAQHPATAPVPVPSTPPAQGRETDAQRREEVVSQSRYFKHWQAIRSEGITASQFIAFLQPFADLDGISVSYVYNDADGKERIYNRHRDDDSVENPLSVAIKAKKISRDEALQLALNDEGRVWIESNFMDLK